MLGLVTEATHGTKRIDLSDIQSFGLGMPPFEEQRGIADILDMQDERLATELREVVKLRTLKLGLMDDLLTGRVRVPVPEETEA